jgi:hypothetical protein
MREGADTVRPFGSAGGVGGGAGGGVGVVGAGGVAGSGDGVGGGAGGCFADSTGRFPCRDPRNKDCAAYGRAKQIERYTPFSTLCRLRHKAHYADARIMPM